MVNRLAYVFTLIVEERWIEFNILVQSNDWMFGHDWDEAEIDDGGMRKYTKYMGRRVCDTIPGYSELQVSQYEQ